MKETHYIALVNIPETERNAIVSGMNLLSDRIRYSFALTDVYEQANAFIVNVGNKWGRDFYEDMIATSPRPIIGYSAYKGERRQHQLKRPIRSRTLEQVLNDIGDGITRSDKDPITAKTKNADLTGPRVTFHHGSHIEIT